MKVLILKMSSLGDIIQAMPAVSYLKKSVKKSEIHWLVNENLCELIERTNIADKTIKFKRDQWNSIKNLPQNLKDFSKFIKTIKQERYDICIDLQCLFRSSIIPFLAGIKKRAGFDRVREGAGFFLNIKAKTKNKNLHAVEENIEVIKNAFSLKTNANPQNFIMKINFSEKEKLKINNMLLNANADFKNLIVINPNSRWESKKWGNEKYLALSERIINEMNMKIAIIGTKNEIENFKIPNNLKNNVLDFRGKTNLIELCYLLQNAKALISNDSGPMHIASVLRTPTIGIFGPTSPKRTGPFWNSKILKSNAKCSPCYKKKCKFKENNYCMNEITVENVFNVLKNTIKNEKDKN